MAAGEIRFEDAARLSPSPPAPAIDRASSVPQQRRGKLPRALKAAAGDEARAARIVLGAAPAFVSALRNQESGALAAALSNMASGKAAAAFSARLSRVRKRVPLKRLRTLHAPGGGGGGYIVALRTFAEDVRAMDADMLDLFDAFCEASARSPPGAGTSGSAGPGRGPALIDDGADSRDEGRGDDAGERDETAGDAGDLDGEDGGLGDGGPGELYDFGFSGEEDDDD